MVPAHTHTSTALTPVHTPRSIRLAFTFLFLSPLQVPFAKVSPREKKNVQITQHTGATRRVNAALGARALREVPAGGSGDGDNAANHCRVNVSTASRRRARAREARRRLAVALLVRRDHVHVHNAAVGREALAGVVPKHERDSSAWLSEPTRNAQILSPSQRTTRRPP